MGLKDAARHRMLNHLAGNAATSGPITHASLHSAFPATSGNELSGGSPAYARQALTFEAVAGTELAGSLDISNAPTFDVPPGSIVAATGYWTALTVGTLMADAPAGAGAPKVFNVDDASTDVLDSKAHGYSNTNTVVVTGSALPTGLTDGSTYFVVSATTDSLKLALTSGGAAIDLTSLGSGTLQLTTIETYAGQGTYQLTDADISVT